MAASQFKVKINDAVLLKQAIGVALYLGSVHWIEDKSQTYVGLELTAKIPNGHNGTYDSQKYFVCKPNQGIILPIESIIRVIKPIELLHKLTELKHTLNNEMNKKQFIKCNASQMKTNLNNNNNNNNVQINGVLLDRKDTNASYEIQLKDTKGQIGDHSVIIPQQYVVFTENPHEKDIENEIKPLQLAPKTVGNPTKKPLASNERRSSISGRRYSVTARQNSMYDYWRKFIAETVGDNDNFMLNNGYILECDSLKNCETTKRIKFLMEYYDEWVFRKSNKLSMIDIDRMIDFMDNLENYNMIKLFNDYYHLIDHHFNGLVVKKDTFYTNFECNRMDCVSLMRHYKDVCVINDNYAKKQELYFIDEDKSNDYDDIYHQNKTQNINGMELKMEKEKVKQKEISQEIILQQILDKMHCFLCHNIESELDSFTNMKINQCFDDDLQAITHKINEINEWKRIKAIRPTTNDLLYDKFTTRLVTNNETDLHIVGASNYDALESKYNNLKNEMLSSTKQHKLDVNSWCDIYDLSLIIKESDKTRKMAMDSGQMVTIEYIICLILYCNHLQIRNEFKSEYRTRNDKKKYAEFGNVAKILKVFINTFGVELDTGTKDTYFYHTIEWKQAHSLLSANKLMFDGIISITQNVLTTILFESSIDLNKQKNNNRLVFCMNNVSKSDGIMMNLDNNKCKTIDCSFVNQYAFEDEMLLMNANDNKSVLFITNIVNVVHGNNYILYLNAFKLFSFVFMDNNKENDLKYGLLFDNIAKRQLFEDHVQKTLIDLLTNKVSKEIKHWFDGICNQKIDIKINENALIYLHDDVIKVIGDKHSKSISIHKICEICPKLSRIHSNCITLNDENVDFILNKALMAQSTLESIHIVLSNNHSPNLQTVLQKYRQLQNCLWSLNLDGNMLKLDLCYFFSNNYQTN